MDMRSGNGDAIEQCPSGQSKIAFRMIGRHVTFIAPEEMDTRPVDAASRIRESFVDRARSITPGQADDSR